MAEVGPAVENGNRRTLALEALLPCIREAVRASVQHVVPFPGIVVIASAAHLGAEADIVRSQARDPVAQLLDAGPVAELWVGAKRAAGLTERDVPDRNDASNARHLAQLMSTNRSHDQCCTTRSPSNVCAVEVGEHPLRASNRDHEDVRSFRGSTLETTLECRIELVEEPRRSRQHLIR